MKIKSAICWFDIPTLDFDRAVKFYSDILGKPVKVSEFMGQKLGFFPMEKDGEVGGDIVPPDKSHVPTKDGSRVYLTSNDDLDLVTSRVENAGGEIVRKKYSIGDMGFIVLIVDTEGNTIGLHGSK